MIGKILNGKYKIESLLGKGGMGTVYLCKNIDIGNFWAVKHIPTQGKNIHLAAEIDILKKLQHIGLPQIVDVFKDEEGLYIVESYVEGKNLGDMLKEHGSFDEDRVISWAKQLADALIYFHEMKPHPIIYRDMKPSNIIITRDDRPVIVDFGISKEYKTEETSDKIKAYTKAYAAPEQFTSSTLSDERTDIYGLGVTIFNVLTGKLPRDGIHFLESNTKGISRNLEQIILKCIQTDPQKRYQTARELKSELEKLDQLKITAVKHSIRNKIILSLSVFFTITSVASSALGLNTLYLERQAILNITPELVLLTEQQESELAINRIYPDGSKRELNLSNVRWESDDNSIAVVKNDKIYAANAGTTNITGRYLDNILNLEVNVSSRSDDINRVDVNLQYNTNYFVTTFAGTGEHNDTDSDLKSSSFLFPQSVAFSNEGEIYVVDSGKIRRIHENSVETIDLGLDASLVRFFNNKVPYLALKPYLSIDDELRSGIIKIENDNAIEVYSVSGKLSTIIDFAFDSYQNLYVLEQSMGEDFTTQSTVTFIDSNTKNATLLRELPGNISSITLDSNDNIYLSSLDTGALYRWEKGEERFTYFAGKEYSKHFFDGLNNRFFEPRKILAKDNYIYILDQNTLRRIILKDGEVYNVETLAGKVHTQGNNNKRVFQNLRGIEATFNRPSDLTIDSEGNILVSDTRNNVIQIITKNSNF